ncbi:MAG: hypothetical protein FH753_16255 [Firmicutes bacterium]|nr:hypothetical protein [Bacillota bacterium]
MKSKLILFLILLCVLGYFIYSYPRKIHIESEGITYKLKGNLTIKDTTYHKMNVKIGSNIRNYIDYLTDSGDMDTFGEFYSNDAFSEVTIIVYNTQNNKKKWSTKDGRLISFPAKNRLKAYNIAKKLLPSQISQIN